MSNLVADDMIAGARQYRHSNNGIKFINTYALSDADSVVAKNEICIYKNALEVAICALLDTVFVQEI